jgi:HAD superfamily hydrolase (TIGR01549 family)
MKGNIEAVLFDIGGTLRLITKHKHEEKIQKLNEIIDLLGADADASEFYRLLTKRSKAYKKWAEENLIELNEVEFWTRWMLPDWPTAQISRIASRLNQLWRDAIGTRIVLPETREVVLELFRRGYRLGIVSNTIASAEVPHALENLGISGCFDTVLLSCNVGTRKPDPSILLMAAERIGIQPERCAYVGDRPDRDVTAAINAGFGRTVILRDPQDNSDLPQDAHFVPNHTINNLRELLDIFPPRVKARGKHTESDGPIYDASLSTMWAKNNFSFLGDFFLAAGRLGFSKIELNHQINSEMLNSIDLDKYEISSIHEPCPADISMETLKERDWLISSGDEDCRQQGVAAIKRSIELANSLSVRTLVVHAGMMSLDMALENKLRSLFHAGLVDTAEYLETKSLMVEKRAKLSGLCMEAVMKSLKELLECASRFGVRLGLENRYHYFDIPTQDEMSILLDLAGPDRIGFIYDVGHAQTMDRLGFFQNEMWLKRFGNRIYGTHIHDVIGINDHYAPGLGEVDFHLLAGYLPKDAFCTLEVMSFNTLEQIKAGLQKLSDSGCINRIL